MPAKLCIRPGTAHICIIWYIFLGYSNGSNKINNVSFRKGVFDLYSDERNRTAEIISKQVPMVVCSKVLKASETKESLVKKSEILTNGYSCEWFSLNGSIDVFNFIADGV